MPINRTQRDARYRFGDEASVRRRLSREAHTCTVSYRRSDGAHTTTIGHGGSLAARITDADAQLPPGDWVRVCISTPTSIYSDIRGREINAEHSHAFQGDPRAYAQEGKTVQR